MRWLSRCCYCVSLRTGGLAVAAWTLFLALLMITLQVINVMSMENLTSYQIKHGGINVKSSKVLASLEIGFGVVLTVVSLLLSIAIMKERCKLLLPYIVGVVLYEIFDFSSLMFYVGSGVQMDCSIWIPDAAMLCVNMYCVIAVLSLYKEMINKERWALIHDIDIIEY